MSIHIMDKKLRVTMPDGSSWDVPISVIAVDRAAHYAGRFDGDESRSLDEGTIPLFESNNDEIEIWAANNMDWSDVEASAVKVSDPTAPDYQESWVNGDKEIVD